MPDSSEATLIIQAMITPALLILGSGSLLSTAMVRLARVVDRARNLSLMSKDDLAKLSVSDHERKKWLETYKHRAGYVEKSVTSFFSGVACFVVDCLSIALDRLFKGQLTWLPVSLTILGMGCMLFGAFMMLRECRLAIQQVKVEIP